MRKEISAEIKIMASPSKVWSVLTNFNSYPLWNPFIKSLTGEVKVGNKIKVVMPGMTFKPTVLKFNQPSEFSWIGHFLFPGLFDGEHSFVLATNEDGSTTFKQSETFNGVLVSFFSKILDKKTKPGFEQFNMKLKEQAER